MAKKRKRPSLRSHEYEQWLVEAPKVINGQLTIEAEDPEDRANQWLMAQEVAPGSLADLLDDGLYIVGVPNDAGQFRIKVVPNDGVTDFFLMAHIDHHNGPFTADGHDYGVEQPHFHEWRWVAPNPRPKNTQTVPDTIKDWTDIWPADLLEAFSAYYNFTDEDGQQQADTVKGKPSPARQQRLQEYFQ